jgi:hypothetical protein
LRFSRVLLDGCGDDDAIDAHAAHGGNCDVLALVLFDTLQPQVGIHEG